MSAIARVLLQAGVEVSGSDARDSAALSNLRSLGVKADVGHRWDQPAGADVVIYSSAVADDNPELERARADGVPVMPRGEALARIVRPFRTVAISGTHGKTTTSGMVATVVRHAGLDPTYLLGADLPGFGPGGHLGNGSVAVVEADEAYKSFLWLSPAIAVVTNVDKDHVEHYGDWELLQKAFREFLESAQEASIICSDDPCTVAVAEGLETTTYGLNLNPNVSAEVRHETVAGSKFNLRLNDEPVGEVNLRLAGRHNISNALGAIAACLKLGLEIPVIISGLERYQGASRRFEYRGEFAGAHLVDDYAHHPTEIAATLAAARFGGWRRVIAVFQPHLYSRTRALWREFGCALSAADLVVVTDVYGAREQPVPGVTGKLIVDSVNECAPGKPVAYLPLLGQAARYLRDAVRPNDLVLTLGAGDITTLPDRLSEE